MIHGSRIVSYYVTTGMQLSEISLHLANTTYATDRGTVVRQPLINHTWWSWHSKLNWGWVTESYTIIHISSGTQNYPVTNTECHSVFHLLESCVNLLNPIMRHCVIVDFDLTQLWTANYTIVIFLSVLLGDLNCTITITLNSHEQLLLFAVFNGERNNFYIIDVLLTILEVDFLLVVVVLCNIFCICYNMHKWTTPPFTEIAVRTIESLYTMWFKLRGKTDLRFRKRFSFYENRAP